MLIQSFLASEFLNGTNVCTVFISLNGGLDGWEVRSIGEKSGWANQGSV